MAFRNGIYKVLYDDGDDGGGDGEHALVILRDGALLGSDPNGAIFSGTTTVDDAGRHGFAATLTVPPYGILRTGFLAGCDGAKIALSGQLEPGREIQRAVAHVGDAALPITLCYMGPLPD